MTLQASDYQLSFMEDSTLKRGSTTLTGSNVIIAFSKKPIGRIQPLGQIGIDINERNITWSDSAGQAERADMSEVAELKERYREIKAKVARRTQNDRRVTQRLLSRYGRREKDRTIQRITW